jgi:uncharacterized protein DUF6600
MTARRVLAALLALSLIMSSPGLVRAADPPPAPPAPPAPATLPAPAGSPEAAPASDVTPARVSYLNGQVSFWRPGAQDWAPMKVNMPLAPGDLLYTGQGGNVEIQVGPRAFVRASEGTQIGLDNQEPDFVQFRVTAGHVALDLRELTAGQTVELDTPNGAFTVERTGYYHAAVTQESTTFKTHRGGSATLTPAGSGATPIAANQQVVITGTESPRVEIGAAPALTAWDRWNYQRTDYLLQPASARYVSPGVYGGEVLNQYGSWRTDEAYGSVWVPARVPTGWVPYSTGRWIWDPRFGWTWLDDAPWGWAPYHYGRWVFVGGYWAWAPGPIVVRPAYSPALVVFLGSGVSVSIGRPLCWAPLGWGEPVIPWWGRPGFVGRPWWGGWGGPRVVNNIVVNRTTNINVTNITTYRNVNVTNAVVGVPAERFGHGHVQPARMSLTQVQQLTPVRGALGARPVAASVQPATGPAAQPPAAMQARTVVATRAAHDVTPTLRAHDLAATPAVAPPPRLVPAPRSVAVPANASIAPGARPGGAPIEATGTPGPPVPGQGQRRGRTVERTAPPPLPGSPKPVPAEPRGTVQSDAPAGSPKAARPETGETVPSGGPAGSPKPVLPAPRGTVQSDAPAGSAKPVPPEARETVPSGRPAGSPKAAPPEPRETVPSGAPAGSETRKNNRAVGPTDQPVPAPIARPGQEGAASRHTPSPPVSAPGARNGASQRAPEAVQPEPRPNRPSPSPAPADRPSRPEPPGRGER